MEIESIQAAEAFDSWAEESIPSTQTPPKTQSRKPSISKTPDAKIQEKLKKPSTPHPHMGGNIALAIAPDNQKKKLIKPSRKRSKKQTPEAETRKSKYIKEFSSTTENEETEAEQENTTKY